jgi:nicotinamide-nucleotide amidase
MAHHEGLVSCAAKKGAAGASLDSRVASLLRKGGFTLALAESCSGGLIAKRITDIPGASAYFLLGLVTYANSAKKRLLGVPAEVLDRCGAVSAETAWAMAIGIQKLAESDIAIATTGIAGPDGGTSAKPVGTVYIAIAAGGDCRVFPFRFNGDRETVRESTADAALDLLFQHLQEQLQNNCHASGE